MREIYRFACPTGYRHCSVYRRGDRFKCNSCGAWFDEVFDKKKEEMVNTEMYIERVRPT